MLLRDLESSFRCPLPWQWDLNPFTQPLYAMRTCSITRGLTYVCPHLTRHDDYCNASPILGFTRQMYYITETDSRSTFYLLDEADMGEMLQLED